MQFIRGGTDEAVNAIHDRIAAALANHKGVLWLTSGGSNIPLEVAVMRRLRETSGDGLEQLTILPMDERYGPAGDASGNTAQLRQAGFQPRPASWVDVLASNLPLAETVEFYSAAAATALAAADVVVGQFGMGADGHIAGIKPHSPATAADAATVVGYEWSDYTRLSLCAETLRQVDIAYLPAFGSAKAEAIRRLRANTELFEALPAVLLYKLPETYVYTDV